MADASAAVAARLVLVAPRVVHAEPLPALPAGRWWRLEVTPELPREAPASAAELAATARREAIDGRLDATLGEEVMDLAASLEEDALKVRNVPVLAGERIVLEAPITAAALRAHVARFVPAKKGAPGAFRVADAAAILRRKRARLSRLRCEAVRLQPENDGDWSGEYAAPGGALPLRLRLSAAQDPAAPLVIAVDGLTGSMKRFLAEVGESLTGRGLNVLAVELPRHGVRSDGSPYLDPADPSALAEILVSGVLDVMAALRQVRECGLLFPDGERLAPLDLRYLGFSLGGMTGVLLRAAEPYVSRMAWVAPSADLADWLLLQAARARGVPLVSCAGGPDSGTDCFGHGRCAAPGVCAVDPLLDLLGRQLRYPWLVAAAGADPADYAATPAGDAEVLIVSGSADGILHPRQTRRLTDILGPASESGSVLSGAGWQRHEFEGLGHGLLGYPEVAARVFDFLASPGDAPSR